MIKAGMKLKKIDKTILAINVLDHFDIALYAFLAPKIAPLFFPAADPVVQLILAYSVLATSLVTRPLGVWLFGGYVTKHTPLKALRLSLAGVAVTTCAYGILPTYEQLGPLSPALLTLLRTLRGVFSSGEHTIARLYLLEGKHGTEGITLSSHYQSSTVLGLLIASGLSTFLLSYCEPVIAWRASFLFAGLVSIGFLMMRLQTKERSLSFRVQPKHMSLWEGIGQLYRHRRSVFLIFLTTGFSHLTYLFPFVLLNSLVPLMTDITFEQMLFYNTGLLIFDLVLMFLFGQWLNPYKPTKILALSAGVLAMTCPFLFPLLKGASLWKILFIRSWIVFWGVMFACPLTLFQKDLFTTKDPLYFLCGMGGAAGSAIFGKLFPSVFFFMWYHYQSFFLLSSALTLLGMSLFFTLYKAKSCPQVMQETST